MTKGFLRVAGVFAALAILVSSASAYTTTQPGDLVPPGNQTFSANGTFNGSAHAIGSGVVFGIPVVIPDQNIPLSLKSPLTVNSNPTNTDGPVQWTLTDPNLRTLSDIQNLDLDLLNGQTANFALNQFQIATSLIPIAVDINGTLTKLSFTQTGATVAVPGGLGTGTFSTAGDLGGEINPLHVSVLGGAAAFDTTLNIPATSYLLTGSYTVTPAVGGRHIALDGTVNLVLPLSLSTALAVSSGTSLGVTASVDLLSTFTVTASYHLETFVVPEPGSIALLGLGVAALIPVLRYRRKK